MSFRSDILQHQSHVRRNIVALHHGASRAALNSIKYGSTLTSAPGQPVQEGDLRESWKTRLLDEMLTEIYTDSPYAPPNEDGINRQTGGPYVLRSAEGGRWSVYKTRMNFDILVDYIAMTLEHGR
jgi:hypothetical protein